MSSNPSECSCFLTEKGFELALPAGLNAGNPASSGKTEGAKTRTYPREFPRMGTKPASYQVTLIASKQRSALQAVNKIHLQQLWAFLQLYLPMS